MRKLHMAAIGSLFALAACSTEATDYSGVIDTTLPANAPLVATTANSSMPTEPEDTEPPATEDQTANYAEMDNAMMSDAPQQ